MQSSKEKLQKRYAVMPEILECMMLICFGLSWPINVSKNFRSRSTKGMSLMFTFLIIAGYIAGICAKIMNGSISYVLAVYVINLAMVSLNVLIYFRNKKIESTDKQLKTAKAHA